MHHLYLKNTKTNLYNEARFVIDGTRSFIFRQELRCLLRNEATSFPGKRCSNLMKTKKRTESLTSARFAYYFLRLRPKPIARSIFSTILSAFCAALSRPASRISSSSSLFR